MEIKINKKQFTLLVEIIGAFRGACPNRFLIARGNPEIISMNGSMITMEPDNDEVSITLPDSKITSS